MRTNLIIATFLLAPLLGVPIARAAGETGFLDVASTPAAQVFIDGKDTGKTTPVVHFELPAGHHQLKLVSLDGKLTRSLGFTVHPADPTRLKINLGP